MVSSAMLRRARRVGTGSISGVLLLLVAIFLTATASSAGSEGERPQAPETAVAVVNVTGEEIVYDVVDGMAVIENDIVLGTHAEVQQFGLEPLEVAPAAACPPGLSCGVILTSSQRMWPNGVIPYTLASGTSDSAAANIAAAIGEWESKTSVRFVARTNESDYVEFAGTGSSNVCSSRLGRVGGRQLINYGGNGRGCLVHEIGHAVGLDHEHSRADRDQYINIDFSNIINGGESQFRQTSGATDVGAYDFNSVMHYSAYAFSLDPRVPVITAKDGRDPRTIGGRGVLTESDIQAVEFIYGGSTPPEETTTTTEATTPSTEAPTTTEASTTSTAPSTDAPTSTEATTSSTEAPTTTEATTSSTEAPTTTEATTTSSDAPPSSDETTSTSEGTTTTESTSTTQPGVTLITQPPTTTPTPVGDQKPIISFTAIGEGATVPTQVPYGGLTVTAYDPDAGTGNGAGIRWVTMVLRDAETGRFLGARREYRSTYDWGLRLQSGRSYTLTAYAVSDSTGGQGWSQSTITITAQ